MISPNCVHETAILEQLQTAVTEKEKAKGQLHKVFEESFDAKSIDNKHFFLQKLNYIHLNPVCGDYKLINDWREYEHSSAAFVKCNKQNILFQCIMRNWNNAGSRGFSNSS